MKLLFKQRFFSWFDSYDIYNELGETVYVVKGELAWGHLLRIYDAYGRELGYIKQKMLTWLPRFEIYDGNTCAGCISKELSFFKPKFRIEYNGENWKMDGNWLEWDYQILDSYRGKIAEVSKQLWNWTDTYVLDIVNPDDALGVLMVIQTIDARNTPGTKTFHFDFTLL